MDELMKLTKAYESNKLSHAYLFDGDDAERMKNVAFEFAQRILCDDAAQCQSKVANLNHPDFMYIRSDEATIKKAEMERLVHYMNQLPIESTYKVYVIEDFEKLTVQSENSILKFLEEPPKNTIAILTTTQPGQVLNTIHSRCQHVHFDPVQREVMVQRLTERGITQPVAEMLRTYTSQIDVAAALNDQYDLGALRKSILRWCELLLSNPSMALIHIVELLKQAKQRQLQLLTLSTVSGYFQDMMYAKLDIQGQYTFADEHARIVRDAQNMTLVQITQWQDVITEGHKKLTQNVNPTLVFEQIVIKGVL